MRQAKQAEARAAVMIEAYVRREVSIETLIEALRADYVEPAAPPDGVDGVSIGGTVAAVYCAYVDGLISKAEMITIVRAGLSGHSP